MSRCFALAIVLLGLGCLTGEDDPATGKPVQYDLELDDLYFQRLPTALEQMVQVEADTSFDVVTSLIVSRLYFEHNPVTVYEAEAQVVASTPGFVEHYFDPQTAGCQLYQDEEAFSAHENTPSAYGTWLEQRGKVAPKNVLIGPIELRATLGDQPFLVELPVVYKNDTGTIAYSTHNREKGVATIIAAKGFPCGEDFQLVTTPTVGEDSFRETFTLDPVFTFPAAFELLNPTPQQRAAGPIELDVAAGWLVDAQDGSSDSVDQSADPAPPPVEASTDPTTHDVSAEVIDDDPSSDSHLVLTWNPPPPSAQYDLVELELLLETPAPEDSSSDPPSFHSYMRCASPDNGRFALPRGLYTALLERGPGQGTLIISRTATAETSLPGGGTYRAKLVVGEAVDVVLKGEVPASAEPSTVTAAQSEE
ncbi:MAG: hypothetical protein A2284_15230 [Deltaproteobacteria bacterium RIFOXYA12_FULL_61_11]|nr:MAG: hypothetical protein A2284_15230 [Deltaproteobacteria bacterium RIFOXYA12_FULL_61_11]